MAALDELSALPGETSQVQSSWDKLDKRLRTKKAGKKTFWYWMAAACVITCMIILVIMNNNKISDINTNTVVNKPIPSQKESIQSIQVIDETKLVVQSKEEKKQKHNVNPVKTIAVKEKTSLTKAEPVIVPVIEKKDSVQANNIAIKTTIQKPIVFTALKKKIPVVHINELEKPIQPMEAVAGNSDHQPRLRFFKKDNAQESSSSGQDGNIFKIKLSPQN